MIFLLLEMPVMLMHHWHMHEFYQHVFLFMSARSSIDSYMTERGNRGRSRGGRGPRRGMHDRWSSERQTNFSGISERFCSIYC